MVVISLFIVKCLCSSTLFQRCLQPCHTLYWKCIRHRSAVTTVSAARVTRYIGNVFVIAVLSQRCLQPCHTLYWKCIRRAVLSSLINLIYNILDPRRSYASRVTARLINWQDIIWICLIYLIDRQTFVYVTML